jgi:glycosyltransferase involved in cell wall biosynthesis
LLTSPDAVVLERPETIKETRSPIVGRVLLLVTEDWFVLSHFKPLIAVLREIAHDVVIVTRSSGRLDEIEALGARIIEFDYRRPSSNPAQAAASAWDLARILEAEDPDAVHMVAMKAIVLGAAALKLVPAKHAVLHMTGLGLLAVTTSPLMRIYRAAALRMIASLLRKPSSYLLVENPDDLALLRAAGASPGPRFAILGGAGVDPAAFPSLPLPSNDVPAAAFVARMIRSKGVDVLMAAFDRLAGRGVPLSLELCGRCDDGNPDAVAEDALSAWCKLSGSRWQGHVADVREVWQRSDMFVLPARGGEGMPRALLEAAACGRPLIVTNVPGSKHFVRDGIEGFVVPPDDPVALADALECLARDPELRQRMGEAARLRVLQGFTETHVKQSLRAAYQSLLGLMRAA